MKAEDVRIGLELLDKQSTLLEEKYQFLFNACEHDIEYHYRSIAEDDCYFYCTVCKKTFDDDELDIINGIGKLKK